MSKMPERATLFWKAAAACCRASMGTLDRLAKSTSDLWLSGVPNERERLHGMLGQFRLIEGRFDHRRLALEVVERLLASEQIAEPASWPGRPSRLVPSAKAGCGRRVG